MKRKQIVTGAGLGLGAILVAPAAAQADDFTVTNLSDDNFGPPGSLRAAVEEADDNPGADRVLFQSKLSGTINLTGRAIYIGDSGGDAGNLEIIGPGARQLTIDADSGFPALAPFANYLAAPPIDVTISGLRITGGNNTSGYLSTAGGGIQAFGDVDLTLSKMTVVGNHADDGGGGIGVVPGSGGAVGEVVIEESTVSGNTTDESGGGIYATYDAGLEIRSSTISGNQAGVEGGGALLPASGVVVLNSTVTANHAADGDGGGGLYEVGVDPKILRGTIVAGNTTDSSSAPDLDDGPWATSFSLIGDTTGASEFEDDGGNLLNVDPKLKPLKNNGGPTDTHAFKKSPAKNKGPSDAPNSDQRGAPRKGKPDIGAYELTKCKGVIVNRVGTAGKDKLKGTKRKDGILGLGGNDKLSGKKGKDGLCGGSGKDKLKGGPGKDKLDGGPGKDKEIQ